MTKETFARSELEKADARKLLAQSIQQLYESWLDGQDPDTLTDLLEAVSKFSAPVVQRMMSNSAHYTPSDLPDALQEGLLAVSMVLQRHAAEGTRMEGFPWFARTVCRNQAAQMVREQYRQMGKYVHTPLTWEDDQGKEQEFLGKEDGPGVPEQELEQCSLNRRLLLMYCDTLMGYDKEPQKALGVCYARVLYQIESLFENQKQTHTASSIPWAWERMGDKNLVKLGMESQNALQEHLHPQLRWRKPFLQKLREESPFEGEQWKDVVYTRCFTKAQTSNWVESIHASVFGKVRRKIQADKKLLEAVKTLNSPLKQTMKEAEVSK